MLSLLRHGIAERVTVRVAGGKGECRRGLDPSLQACALGERGMVGVAAGVDFVKAEVNHPDGVDKWTANPICGAGKLNRGVGRASGEVDVLSRPAERVVTVTV